MTPLTWNLVWNQYNTAQKLSGQTYTDPSGHTVDCTYVDVTFSSSIPFVKFYATAVKNDGRDYGFINNVLVDIRETNPTGVKLYELTSRAADTQFSFRISASQLLSGDGNYRIGMYVQDGNGYWNYEYFFLTTESNSSHLNVEMSDSKILQVTVKTN